MTAAATSRPSAEPEPFTPAGTISGTPMRAFGRGAYEVMLPLALRPYQQLFLPSALFPKGEDYEPAFLIRVSGQTAMLHGVAERCYARGYDPDVDEVDAWYDPVSVIAANSAASGELSEEPHNEATMALHYTEHAEGAAELLYTAAILLAPERAEHHPDPANVWYVILSHALQCGVPDPDEVATWQMMQWGEGRAPTPTWKRRQGYEG